MAWQLTWLDGLAVEHAYWKGEVLGSNLRGESISLIKDFDLSAQEETDKTLGRYSGCCFSVVVSVSVTRRARRDRINLQNKI